MANIETVVRLVTAIAPLIGGLVAIWLGQVWLTVFAAIVVSLAIIPVWRMDELDGGHKRVVDLRYNLKHAPVRDLVANFGFNVHAQVGNFVWPIYLAVLIPSFTSIGAITTIALLATFVILRVAGKRGDAGKNYRVLVEGTAFCSVVHVGRMVASSNPVTATVVTTVYDTAIAYQFNPWLSLYYAHARKGGINYIMSMEMANDIATITLWSVLGVAAYLASQDVFFGIAFFGAAVLAWLCLLMRPEAPAMEKAS